MDSFKFDNSEEEDLGKELLDVAERIDRVIKKVEEELDPTWSSIIESVKIDASRFSNSLRELAQEAYGEN